MNSDNPINQTILSTFMRKKKIKYDVAKNGEEAVQKWRSGGFHLILVGLSESQLVRFSDEVADGHSDACHGRNPGNKGNPTT